MPRTNLNIQTLIGQKDMRFEPPASALAKWQPEIHAAASDDESTINIYDSIGEDPWTGQGMTPKIVSAILRKNQGKAVTVNINSPGGSFFDGVAIYNLLKQHDGDVHVRVVGMAASAASIVAMAGDTILVGKSAFIMIHNAWTIALGNKEDMRDCADTLAKFDQAMADIYADVTGKSAKDIAKTMDSGDTWLQGPDAVEQGYATGLLEDDEMALDEQVKDSYNSSLRQVDIALAKAGMTRSERRAHIKNLSNTQDAVVQEPPTPCAGTELTTALSQLLQTVQN